MKFKTCKYCGESFHVVMSRTLYCSRKCYWDDSRKPNKNKGRKPIMSKINDLGNAEKWFWSKVAIKEKDECWLWHGKDGNRYGNVSRFYDDKRSELSHRVAYYLTHNRFPIGVTRHTCDLKHCCNPNHLIEGSRNDNIQDAVERNLTAYGKKSASAKLSDQAVISIRNSPLSHKELAERHGVHSSTILRARRKDTWRRADLNLSGTLTATLQ